MIMQFLRYRLFSILSATVVTAATCTFVLTTPASAAACTPPGDDYGIVDMTSSISASGTYRIWTRMAAPNSTDNSFMLEIDGSNCYVVGGSGVPVYADGSSVHFQSGKSNWIPTTTSGEPMDVSLSAGSHNFKLIGTSTGVVVDRIVVTADTACVPIDLGDNCASVYVAADINEDSAVDFIDFSILADKYTQDTGSLGRSDINNDGIVNFLDYSILANKYGE